MTLPDLPPVVARPTAVDQVPLGSEGEKSPFDRTAAELGVSCSEPLERGNIEFEP